MSVLQHQDKKPPGDRCTCMRNDANHARMQHLDKLHHFFANLMHL